MDARDDVDLPINSVWILMLDLIRTTSLSLSESHTKIKKHDLIIYILYSNTYNTRLSHGFEGEAKDRRRMANES